VATLTITVILRASVPEWHMHLLHYTRVTIARLSEWSLQSLQVCKKASYGLDIGGGNFQSLGEVPPKKVPAEIAAARNELKQKYPTFFRTISFSRSYLSHLVH